ncbi:ABC transporter permease [Micromonospora sp. NPDC005087]|uniref:ABC transporter permease n=1 Tax=Micromonospora sp. NPDC005087 TaxID=3364225 RepID=UPI0036A39CDB
MSVVVPVERVASRRRVLHRVAAHPTGRIGLLFVGGVLLVALLAPVLAPFGAEEITGTPALQGPSGGHWLGTDELGRDVLSRIIWGSQTSLQVSVLATLLALVVALPLGLVAGYFRGALDTVVMRLTDTSLAFPFIVLAVGLAAIFGPSRGNAALAIGISQVPLLIRVTRGEALAIREEDYITASVADGAGSGRIIARHVLPNVINTVIVQATVLMPFAIITESMLSFLGLGVQPPTPSWGVMLTAAQAYTTQAPLLAVFPGVAIFIAALGFNLLGNGVRDALDPRGRR